MRPRNRTAQRSRSQGDMLIEHTSQSGASRYSASATEAAARARNTQLIRYSPWRVILYRRPAGQVVLYNPDSEDVEVRHVVPQTMTASHLQPPSSDLTLAHQPHARPHDLQSYSHSVCPTCLQAISTPSSSAWEPRMDVEADGSGPAGVIADSEYFGLLARSLRLQRSPLALSDGSKEHHYELDHEKSPTAAQGDQSLDLVSPSEAGPSSRPYPEGRSGVAESSFNQGYYERFFSEQKKLGKGLRGSVFSCQHILDGIYLGHYAVKKVPVGNNHQWLKRMLREVKLLESLRHPNVVEYKHSWLEVHRQTQFGPKVPCLFILMEYANGGNLQEYMEPGPSSSGSRSATGSEGGESPVSLKQRILKMRREKSQVGSTSPKTPKVDVDVPADNRRMLTIEHIWSFFSDICNGLAHLHQLQIIHRDLKHMNLLLNWQDLGSKNANGEIPRIMLTDFGECEVLSHLEKRSRTGATGTMEFMAPELLEVDDRGRYLDSYTTKSDMWSLGMVLYYLCYSRLPFANIDDIDALRSDVLRLKNVDSVKVQRPEEAEDIPPELHRIMRMLLNHDEAMRPDIGEIIQIVESYRDLWRSRRHGEMRFEVHESDIASSHPGTPRVATPVMEGPGRAEYPDTAPLPSRPLDKVATFTGTLGEGAVSRAAQRTAAAPSALVLAPTHTVMQVGASRSASGLFRRHSTGQHPLRLSEMTTPTPPLSSSEDTGTEREPLNPQSPRHVSTIAEATRDGSGPSEAHTSSASTLPLSGTKRHLSGTGSQNANGDSVAKRRRYIPDPKTGMAFYAKTAILLAKVHILQRLDLGSASQSPYLMCITLVISAIDIHSQSLLLSSILLAVNIAVIFCWYYGI